MRRDILKLTGSIYLANKSTSKAEHLDAFLDEFELLKLKIRLCVDMKLLPMRKQALLSGLLESIDKQVSCCREMIKHLNSSISLIA